MIICISGDYRSGKSGFATVLASKTNLYHYSMRKLKMQVNTEYNTDFIDWNKELTDSDNNYIDRHILDLAKSGNCILDFRFSAIICKKNNLRYHGIWISASMESRIYGNSYCWNKSYDEVEKIINIREMKEDAVSKRLYGIDYKNSLLYSSFIDLSKYWYPIEAVAQRGMLFHTEIDKVINQLQGA